MLKLYSSVTWSPFLMYNGCMLQGGEPSGWWPVPGSCPSHSPSPSSSCTTWRYQRTILSLVSSAGLTSLSSGTGNSTWPWSPPHCSSSQLSSLPAATLSLSSLSGGKARPCRLQKLLNLCYQEVIISGAKSYMVKLEINPCLKIVTKMLHPVCLLSSNIFKPVSPIKVGMTSCSNHLLRDERFEMWCDGDKYFVRDMFRL